MKYKVGDTVFVKQSVAKRGEPYILDNRTILGKIIFIPKSRRYVLVDVGLYKECFFFDELIFVKKKSGAV